MRVLAVNLQRATAVVIIIFDSVVKRRVSSILLISYYSCKEMGEFDFSVLWNEVNNFLKFLVSREKK